MASYTKMPEEVDTLTFSMPRESKSASLLKATISDMLPLFSDDYSCDILPEYITMLVCNGKSQIQATEDLEAFLGKKSCEFAACLWEILLKNFSRGEQENSASEPKYTVDFASHDTLREPGLISRRHDVFDQRVSKVASLMNDKLISFTTPTDDIEAHVSPRVETMKMLRNELIDCPGKRIQPKKKKDWNSSGFDYSRKILRSVIVSANKQPCVMNPNKHEKQSMDERSGKLQKRLYFPEREMGDWHSQSEGALSARSQAAASHQEMMPRVSVWDRLDRPRSNVFLERNIVLQQHEPAFPVAYNEQQSVTFQREVPAVGYMHGDFQSHKARKPKSETITYDLSRKRRYGYINPNSDASVGEFTRGLQYNQAKQDAEKENLLSYQSAKPDLFSEILDVKQKLQKLEIRMVQLKKQKVGELKLSPQSDELQHQQDATESRIIHVTNVHYAATKEVITMFFRKCGAIRNVTGLTDPVTLHPTGAAFVTFATKESVNKAIALSGTMFYSRPIKVQRHVIASGVMPKTPTPSYWKVNQKQLIV